MKSRIKKIGILFVLVLLSFMALAIGNKCQAADLDEIVNYIVTVDPRMNDGSLDITYEITWKVLDSTTEGPLEWVKIGTPNENFNSPTALTKNIKSITKYSGSYVKIVFDKKYYAGETITFKYSIHQTHMYKISGSSCNYEFTPAWFTDSKVDNLMIKWNGDKVAKSNNKSKEDNYLVWSKSNMSKGSKLTASIKYDKSAFSSLSTSKQAGKRSSGASGSYFFWAVLFVIAIVLIFIGDIGGGGYYGHRGFYGGGFYGGGCAHSSCACACAHSSCASSCACACAGSGRAGCSKKDFYGTNLTTKKLKKVIAKKEDKE